MGNSAKQVSKESNTKSGKFGKFIKNSSNKLKRSFDVFNNKNYENQYETLDELENGNEDYEDDEDQYDDQDDEDERDRKKIKQSVDLVDDYNNDSNNVVLVDDDSDADYETKQNGESVKEVIPKEQEPQEEEETNTTIKTGNDLDDNNDFISLNFSDSDDQDDEQSELDNEEDAYSMDDDESNPNIGGTKIKNDVPWIKNHDHSTQKEIADWLTLEIKDFIAYISPSKEEIELRNNTVRKLREAIMELWPDCEVHVFGSYATDLYLPGSDIDMVIVSEHGGYESRNSLYSLSSFLKRKNLAKNVEVIAKAKVPIIKFTESTSNIHIDVSFERTNGIDAAKTIRSWITETPGLREIVLIVKQFLSSRKLNNVHVGGLGGYSIICLVYSFLILHPRLSTGNISPYENLGVLLIEFFELYGKNFGYDNVAICVEPDNVCYLNKKYYPDLQGRSSFALSIQDPSDPSNNISRGSFNIRDIKKAFAGAYELLTNGCYDLDTATYKQRIGKSILGNVVRYKGAARDFNDERSLVINEALNDDGASIVSKSKVYFSEQDLSSDDDFVPLKTKESKTNKPKPNVDKLMGLEDEDDDSSNDEKLNNKIKKKNSNSSLTRDERRDFWLQKGKSLT
ncbi:Poly(A) RNA polymerase protein 1 [Wickerhamomyces ciferrii]|uniref:polynucleotide adenylyltransferase n=1 Tax=Wickerhamomyces ciferrii (strain ATCC 14091 / BCRC 22168 / CBS 111 / JCM 3599 / NBRC 0793 / NRRL Y-1031 F-60-10) TaxID=1206466 RepID=K0KKQ8_WICCF|nr:Poly(A) RNA polymerase protein 1 [Wickerhamomyces ciferrii]CCH43591.1 Poly(A) RNA polymerase protein 1 [Wickerhamomyces ciferrii]